jgi:hypothetical protein
MRIIHVPAEYRPMIEDSADFERSEQREQFEREESKLLEKICGDCAELIHAPIFRKRK